MFKKSSRAKNIRRKIDTADDEPETVNEETIVQKTITSLAEKKKKREAKKTISLSFDQEEEGGEGVEEFQVKKTNKGYKLQIREDLNPLADLTDTTTHTTTTSYDIATLNELRAATPSLSAKSTMSSEDALLHEKFPSTANPTTEISGIPDASAILAAKKKREQMRKGFTIRDQDDGFIALDSKDETELSSGRLIREEDDIGDDGEAEFDKYVGGSFTINQGKAKAMEKERRDDLREMIDEAEQDEEQSEDIGRWEEDMIKFGGAKTQRKSNDPFAAPLNYRPAQVPESAALPTLADVMSSLNLAANDMAFSMEQHKNNLAEAQKSMDSLKTTERDIEREIERGSGRYTYFQELSQFANDLGEFLDAKFPELEDLEEKAHSMFASDAEVIISRQWQNTIDDLSLFAQVQYTGNETEEDGDLDEFGRMKDLKNSDTARRRRREERIQRIARQADLAELSGEEATREQGLWTDDELQEEHIIQRDDKLQDIEMAQVNNMMNDVNNEFKSLAAVKSKFEAWKTMYYDDYQKAYGSLSLPTAFEFYVRLELVTWNPFCDSLEFDSMEWHRTLSEYGLSSEHEDPDTEMLNKIVEKVIIKKVKSYLETLNARSSRQMRHASQVMEQVSYYVDPNEKAYKDLAIELVHTLEKQISRIADVVETSTLKSNLDQEAIEAKHRFFWSQCKYLKTLAFLRRQISRDQLDRLVNIVSTRLITPILQPQLDPLDAQLHNEMLSLLSVLQRK
ncbi:nineteen complex-related protein 2-domain-containing protein [Rhizopus microsporus]